jgi:hypothetical protein
VVLVEALIVVREEAKRIGEGRITNPDLEPDPVYMLFRSKGRLSGWQVRRPLEYPVGPFGVEVEVEVEVK